MKRFASLFLAAVLGSASTVGIVKWLDNNKPVKLEYMSGVPSTQVAYRVDEH
jgi:hypothetical protein